MKSKHLLLMLLMALLVPWAANAQEELTVYEETNTTNNYAPMFVFYFDDYTRAQTVFPAEDLAQMNGGTITAITFYTTSSYIPYTTVSSADIYLTEVASTTISAYVDKSSATTVCTGYYDFVSDGEDGGMVTITFDTPYQYGGGNLLFGCDNTEDTGYKSIYFKGITATGASISGYNSSAGGTITTNQRNFLPKTTFTYTTAPVACAKPTGLNCTEVLARQATFTWTAEEGATYQYAIIENGEEAPADGDYINVYDQTNTVTVTTGLNPETDYVFYLRRDCTATSEGYSTPATKAFSTPESCPAPVLATPTDPTAHGVTLSWTGNYESYTVMYREPEHTQGWSEPFNSTSLPTGWSRYGTLLTDDVLNGTTALTSVTGTWTNTSYGLGAYNWKINLWNTKNHWMVTPEKEVAAGYILSFDAAVTAYNSNNAPSASNAPDANSKFIVLISNDEMATWTVLQEWNGEALNAISNTGDHFTIDLTDYVGSSVYVAFYAEQKSGPDCDLHIDNVAIGLNIPATEWAVAETNITGNTVTLDNAAIFDPETTYEVKVVATCNNDEPSVEVESNVMSFTTDEACPAPTALAVSQKTAYTAVLDWNVNGTETEWVVTIKAPGDNGFLHEIGGIDAHPYTIGLPDYDLQPNTTYTWKVRAGGTECDPLEKWSNEITFTTDEACPMPTLNAATNITQTGANISWNASPDVESYTLQYREAAYVEGLGEAFDATSIPSGWARYTGLLAVEGNTGTATLASASYGWSFGANHNVLTGNHAYVNIYGNYQRWLVTPKFEVSVDNLEFDMALTAYTTGTMAPETDGTDDKFMVLVSTDDMATWTILRQWTNEESAEYVYNNISATEAGEHVTLDMSAYNGQEVYVAFYGESTTSNADNNLHIDNVMCGTFIEAGEWETASEEAETPYTLVPENVQPNKKYDVQVKPNCGEEYSASISFTTKKENEFVFLGTEDDDWSNEANWSPEQLPTIDDDVIIRADVTIPALEDWDWAYEANKVTFEGGTTLTIANGGRLASNNSVNGTIQKHINHYEDYYGRDNYYLLSLPVSAGYYGYNPSNAGMITDSEFDLYYFDEAQTGMEWRSYNPGDNGGAPFSLEQRKGYLYANSADVDLSFSGTFMRSDLPVVYNLSNTGTGEFAGLNLVGNPFICQAYITYYDANEEAFLEVDYYVLNGDAVDVTPSWDYLNPCTGAFVVADEDMYDAEEEEYRVYFFSELNSGLGKKKAAALNITLDNNNRSGKHLDVARLRLGQGIGLKKFMMNPNGSKIYFPQANADYSVVYTENAGEMPLNFKAESNGTYRLSFSNENVEFNYLHLIDNMTGADVDLLATPSYSFEANSTDYASRFTIVFATGKTDDSFAYFSNGSFVISNEGNATLQVVDVMGRIISSETINGSANVSVNAAPGVYMLRLVNGDNVKVQKVVVK